MSRFQEYFVQDYKKGETNITLPAGWYSYGNQEGNDISNQCVPIWHSYEEEGNPFEYFEGETVSPLKEVISIEENPYGTRILVDTWVD